MPKKTLILIIVLLTFTVGLIYIAVQTERRAPEEVTPETVEETIPTVVPASILSFTPATIDTTTLAQTTYTADVILNTSGQSASGVQIELSYDPATITNVTVASPTENALLGENPMVLDESVDPALGRISYSAGIGVSDAPVTGAGSIATITFSVSPTAIGTTTQISFLPKSRVTSLETQESILQDTLPLTIILPQSSPQSFPPETTTPLEPTQPPPAL